MVVSAKLLDELSETLLRPKFRRWIGEDDALAFDEILRLAALVVDDPASAERVSGDPDDHYLIALARVGHTCSYREIVTSRRSMPMSHRSWRRFFETVG